MTGLELKLATALAELMALEGGEPPARTGDDYQDAEAERVWDQARAATAEAAIAKTTQEEDA